MTNEVDVRISKEQAAILLEYAKTTGTPVEDVLNQILEEFITEETSEYR